eukprot:TRINITY_DN11323_c0_g1_i1.p2 TRINITY_DN11323_c0_g1~~TRINITY_DN11323_c0_g1_i1.p2  ORF type:complete len:334 (-),score=57.95 TRINITY_DN11323_c0_g1_i1:42-1043(-)
MCRWFAYLGHEPILLADILMEPKHSIIRQIDEHFLPELHEHYGQNVGPKADIFKRNAFLNSDGFGVAWYNRIREQYGDCEGPRPCVYRTIRPPLNDMNLRSICHNTESHVVFAHIRAAVGSSVIETNNHPFNFGRHLFMHNGSVAFFNRIRRQLLMECAEIPYRLIQGTTDSEHVAALYFTMLGDIEAEHSLEEMRVAMLKTLEVLNRLLTDHSVTSDEAAARCSSLNFAVTDGIKMIAMRFRNSETEEPPSLYYSQHAGIVLNRKYPGDPDDSSGRSRLTSSMKSEDEARPHVVIASEPSTLDATQWKLIPKNHLILVNEKMEVTLETIHIN